MNEEKKRDRQFLVIVLLLLVTLVSVGYAVLSSTLNISGTTTVADTSWDVGPDEDGDITCPPNETCTINPNNPGDLTPDDGTPTPENPNPKGAIIWMDGDTVYFKHLLVKPGDVFTFTTTFKNTGNIDAKVKNVTTSELNATAKRFLDYTVTYADGTAVQPNDTLAAGSSATFKVTVSYKSTVTTLPTAAELELINETAEGHTGATSLFTVIYEQA